MSPVSVMMPDTFPSVTVPVSPSTSCDELDPGYFPCPALLPVLRDYQVCPLEPYHWPSSNAVL